MVCDTIAGAEVLEHWHIKLPTVVTDQDPRDTESADNVIEYEFLHLLLGYGR